MIVHGTKPLIVGGPYLQLEGTYEVTFKPNKPATLTLNGKKYQMHWVDQLVILIAEPCNKD